MITREEVFRIGSKKYKQEIKDLTRIVEEKLLDGLCESTIYIKCFDYPDIVVATVLQNLRDAGWRARMSSINCRPCIAIEKNLVEQKRKTIRIDIKSDNCHSSITISKNLSEQKKKKFERDDDDWAFITEFNIAEWLPKPKGERARNK